MIVSYVSQSLCIPWFCNVLLGVWGDHLETQGHLRLLVCVKGMYESFLPLPIDCNCLWWHPGNECETETVSVRGMYESFLRLSISLHSLAL